MPPDEKYILRRATASDAQAIARVHVVAWRRAYQGLLPHSVLDALNVQDKARFWQQLLSRPGPATTVVVEREGTVVAFAVYGASRDADAIAGCVEIVALNVEPGHWRGGLGRALVEHVLASAASWQCISLWVLRGNMRAQRFYERLGFAPDGAEKGEGTIRELRYRRTPTPRGV